MPRVYLLYLEFNYCFWAVPDIHVRYLLYLGLSCCGWGVPVVLLCCTFSLTCRYSLVMHLDTLARDSLYLARRKQLEIDVDFVRREGVAGHTSETRWLGKGWSILY